jgi:hypothetical protein
MLLYGQLYHIHLLDATKNLRHPEHKPTNNIEENLVKLSHLLLQGKTPSLDKSSQPPKTNP